MDDLISRQAAKEAYCKSFCHPGVFCPDGLCKEVNEAFDAVPSAQPEIIHCRECQHHRRDNTGCYYCVRKEYGYGWGLNDFCSDAERRTDA